MAPIQLSVILIAVLKEVLQEANRGGKISEF